MGTKSNIWLHRFAVFTACSTFALVIAGGLVTSTGSGLAVPDWPLSYGQLMPSMVGGIFYEHGHRMVATFVGFLTTILAVWLWRVEERKWVRNLGVIALLAVVTQGVLGGMTVLFLLPTPISVSHATLAQSFFSLTVVLALVTSKGWRDHRPSESIFSGRTRRWTAAATSAVFVQLVLGALMRHTHSGLAIPDFPLTYGQFLPPIDLAGLENVNAYRIQLDLDPVSLMQVWIHFAHRIGAIIVSIIVLGAVRHIIKNYRTELELREPALIALVLLVVQIFLGAITVWSGKGMEIATAHVACGALLLATNVLLTVRTYHLYTLPVNARSYSFAVEGSRV